MWWFFHIEKNFFYLAKSSDFPTRPPDSNPSRGNPFTPWYQVVDHIDSEHIHVYAEDLTEALRKCRYLIRTNASIPTHITFRKTF